MRSLVYSIFLMANMAIAGGPVHLDVLTNVEQIELNLEFDCLLKANGLGGDVVGNGSCDMLGNGSGDVVGNGSGDVVGNGSGDVVGNGGGVIEGTLQYLLQRLPDYLKQTILYADFDYPADMAKALMDIHRSVTERKNPLKLEFISGAGAKNFFFDEHDQEVRSAKTGFSEDYPIYINVEYLYGSNITDERALITLLIHEIGHQVGYTSHSFLDIIGAEVARIVELQRMYMDSVWLHRGFVEVNYLNYKMNGSKSTLSVSYNDSVRHVSAWDEKYFKEQCGQYHPIGFRYRNLSWVDYIELIDNPEKEQAKVVGIIQLNCAGTRGEIKNVHVPFEVEIFVKNNVLSVLRRQYR